MTAPTPVTFGCPSCGGGFVFSGPAHALVCPNCGREEPVPPNETTPEERDLEAALADPDALIAAAGDAGPEQELKCPNCAGLLGFSGTLTATRCPFCASPVQRGDIHAAPRRLPVDGVVPFGLDQPSAKGCVETWIKSRWFAPNAFKKYSSTGSFSAVYLPFFTFDAYTSTEYTGQRGDTRTRTVGSGENRRTETYTDWSHASGTVDMGFNDVAVGADASLDADRLRDLEPWPTGQAFGFRPEYLAGAISRTYDLTLPQCHGNAQERMTDEIRDGVKSDIGGDQQRIHSMETTWSGQTYRHLLLPLFLLVVTFRQEPFQVFVNGVTGEVHGQRPYSRVKIALASLLAAAVGLGVWWYLATKDSQ
ncbi:MAG: hypothetical protein ACT4QG_22955 [Sporichthyaceae bacterium]